MKSLRTVHAPVPTYRIAQPPLDLEPNANTYVGFCSTDPPLSHSDSFTLSDFTVLERTDLILESPPTYKDPFENRLDNRPTRVLGTFSVVAITFLYACGGPLGSEPIVSIAGPLAGLLGFIIYPIVYTIPYASVVAELSATFPQDGGFTIWIMNAFGPFWAVQVGYWSWIAGAVSIAIYPSYILDIISRLTDFDPDHVYFVKAGIAILLSAPALVGTNCVGRLTSMILLLVWLPLVVFVVWGIVETNPKAADALGVVRHSNTTYNATTDTVFQSGGVSIDWYDFLSTLYWNYEGLRMASVFAGQVQNPAQVYKRSITIVVGLTASVYVLPLLATLLSGSVNWTQFDRGTYEWAARALGGEALRAVMVTCSFGTCLGLHICGMFCCSTEISGMAENKLVPVVFAVRNAPCGSPHVAIVITLAIVLALMPFNLDDLLPVANTFGSLVAASIFLAAVQLRHTMPFMNRPVKIAGGICIIAVISVFPVGLCAYIMVKTLFSSLSSAMLVLGFVAPAVIYGGIRSYRFKNLLYR